ncbi:MAG TPA: pilin [Patescibacteria group bacterium]|nr:pilin [Patescibacteria group bacterium]
MKKLTTKRIAALLLTIMTLSLFALPAVVSAGDDPFGIENAAFDGLNSDTRDVYVIIDNIIALIFGFLGILAVLIILWGGFTWMTSAGDETKVEKAKKMIIAGVVGLVIILLAWVIVRFVFTSIQNDVL